MHIRPWYVINCLTCAWPVASPRSPKGSGQKGLEMLNEFHVAQ